MLLPGCLSSLTFSVCLIARKLGRLTSSRKSSRTAASGLQHPPFAISYLAVSAAVSVRTCGCVRVLEVSLGFVMASDLQE